MLVTCFLLICFIFLITIGLSSYFSRLTVLFLVSISQFLFIILQFYCYQSKRISSLLTFKNLLNLLNVSFYSYSFIHSLLLLIFCSLYSFSNTIFDSLFNSVQFLHYLTLRLSPIFILNAGHWSVIVVI